MKSFFLLISENRDTLRLIAKFVPKGIIGQTKLMV